jgi:hypothetical protein
VKTASAGRRLKCTKFFLGLLAGVASSTKEWLMFVLLNKICTVLNVLPMLHVSDLRGPKLPILPTAASQAPAYGQGGAGSLNLVMRCGPPRTYAAQLLKSGNALGFIQLTMVHLGRKATKIYPGVRLSTTNLAETYGQFDMIQLPLNMPNSNHFAHSQYIPNRSREWRICGCCAQI